MSEQIIDASIIAAPRQRDTDAEKAALKEGRIPGVGNPPQKARTQGSRCSLDPEAGQGAPGEGDGSKAKVEIAIPVFGYKPQVSIDRRHGFVGRFSVTSAAAHDGAQLAIVPDSANTASDVYADTAYRSKATKPIWPSRAGARRFTSDSARPRPDAVAAQSQPRPPQSALCRRDGVCRPEPPLRPIRAHDRFGLSRTKIGLANFAHNLKRFLGIEARPVAA